MSVSSLPFNDGRGRNVGAVNSVRIWETPNTYLVVTEPRHVHARLFARLKHGHAFRDVRFFSIHEHGHGVAVAAARVEVLFARVCVGLCVCREGVGRDCGWMVSRERDAQFQNGQKSCQKTTPSTLQTVCSYGTKNHSANPRVRLGRRAWRDRWLGVVAFESYATRRVALVVATKRELVRLGVAASASTFPRTKTNPLRTGPERPKMAMRGKGGYAKGRTPTTRVRKATLARCSALRERRSEAIVGNLGLRLSTRAPR